jgi:hypothetical protein
MIRYILSITAWALLGYAVADLRATYQRSELEVKLAEARGDADEAKTVAQQLLSNGRFILREVAPGVMQWRFAAPVNRTKDKKR